MKKLFTLLVVVLFASAGMFAQTTLASYDFQDNTYQGWQTYTPTYSNDTLGFKWHLSDYSGDIFLRASSYSSGTNFPTEQWVYSPVIDASSYDNLHIMFQNDQNYEPIQDLELYVSTDFDGDSANFASATWNQLVIPSDQLSDGSYNVVVADIDASTQAAGQSAVYFAFKYVSDNTGGGLWDVDSVYIYANESSAISQTVDVRSIVYPSPAREVVHFNTNSITNEITITNMAGQVVKQATVRNMVDISDLPAGIYNIAIKNDEGVIYDKFMKE